MQKQKNASYLRHKNILYVFAFISIAAALLSYQGTATITPTKQFTVGATTASWNVYINQVNEENYLPGGTSEPIFNAGDASTYAFKLSTDTNKVCAVKVELTTQIDNALYSNFDVTIYKWSGSNWAQETLYLAPTGVTTTPSFDGTTPDACAYIHQTTSTTSYYLIKVTYSYDKQDTTTANTATFNYTPMPQDSF